MNTSEHPRRVQIQLLILATAWACCSELACSRFHSAGGPIEETTPLPNAALPGAPGSASSDPSLAAIRPPLPPGLLPPGDAVDEGDNAPRNPAAWGTEIAIGRTFDPIYFDFDSVEIRYANRRALREYADWLAGAPDIWITLEGHCDTSGSSEYNYNLGMARAAGVREELAAMGIARNRLFCISYGEERPAVEETTPEKAALNRRVEFKAFIAPTGQTAPPRTPPPPAPPDARNPLPDEKPEDLP